MSDLKEISDSLKQEFIRATKPKEDFRKFLFLVIDNYRHKTNCAWGWTLYDWLSEHGHLKGFSYMAPERSTEERSAAMDEIIASDKLTLDQIITYINEEKSRKDA